MNVGSTKEKNPEKRISITPDTSKNLKDLGLKVFLEKDYGKDLGYSDEEYKNKGTEFLNSSDEVYSKSDLICKVNLPAQEEINLLKQNTNLIVPGSPEAIPTGLKSKIQTPPLGNTPMPIKMASNTTQKNPVTNLTRNEEALLSPTEKVIASKKT